MENCKFIVVLLCLVASSRGSLQQQRAGGMELDRETEEEIMKAFAAGTTFTTTTTTTMSSSDYGSSMELQDINEDGETKIVLMDEHSHHQSVVKKTKIVYQVGHRDEDLPECESGDVCNKIDVYGDPWLEKQCRCRNGKSCSDSLHTDDGHTIVDRHYRYKTCEPVKRLPVCRYFKDIAWTLEEFVGVEQLTVQRINCRCRPNSSSYIVKRQLVRDPATGERRAVFLFACSPQSRNKCNLGRKEPCRLTTVHKKQKPFASLDEVTSAQLCQCPHGYRCPRKHTDVGNIASRTFLGEMPVTVYSGHCTPLQHVNEPVYTLVH